MAPHFSSKKTGFLTSKDVVTLTPECLHTVKRLYDKESADLFGDVDLELMLYEWLANMYGIENVYSRNVSWIHLLVWDKRYTSFIINPLARKLFGNKFLENIFLLVPPGFERVEFMIQWASRLLPKNHFNPKTVQTLYKLARDDFAPKYKIRKAVEEDNDDLVPLIHSYSTKLREFYGDYYIAEILTRHQDSGRELIVAEFNGTAVAVVCLNESVNYDILNLKFELAPYNGFKKPNENDFLPLEDVDFTTRQSTISVADIKSFTSEAFTRLSTTSNYGDKKMGSDTMSNSSDYTIVMSTTSSSNTNDSEDNYFVRQHVENAAKALNFQEYEDHLTYEKNYDEDDHYTCRLDDEDRQCQRIPIYFGGPNAFTLEIALAHPDHEMSLQYLFEAAFECFPDRDYCLLSIPFETIPMYMKMFMMIIPRPETAFPNALYFLHRTALVAKIVVRRSSEEDEKSILALLSASRFSNVYLQYENSVKSEFSPYLSFSILCDDQHVGIAILTETRDESYIRSQFDLLDYVDSAMHRSGSHGTIENILLSPIFQKHGRYILGELHRISDYTVLYNKIPIVESKDRMFVYVNLLNYMVPVKLRPTARFNMSVLKDYKPSEYAAKRDVEYALFFNLERFYGMDTREINTRIVVIGGSDTAFGFLEALLLTQSKQHVSYFQNITVISTHGFIERHRPGQKLRDMMFCRSDLDENYVRQMSLNNFVNIIPGVLTGINRREKIVIIDQKYCAPYDLLFLMCGEQFQSASVRPDVKIRKEFPENLFVINTRTDADNALAQLRGFLHDIKENVIVYGHYLQAHCCLATLIAYGIPGPKIIYVEPFPHNGLFDGTFKPDVSFYNDPDVDQAVLDAIEKLGIKIYHSYHFSDWKLDTTTNLIDMVKFESERYMVEIKCCAMFFYMGRSVSPKTFKAIIEAGLVFDGKLVIDHTCRTNDKCIYGAGTMTKYERKYYADHLVQRYYNRREVGYKLGLQIRDMLLGEKNSGPESAIDKFFNVNEKINRNDLVPVFYKPLVRHCRLPGGLHYLSIRRPGRLIPLEMRLSRGYYGNILITGDCKNLDNQGYFRLHMNKYNKVETLTCLSKSSIDVYNLACLYGRHEKLLNNIHTRFEMGLITDLFEYFQEAWSYALYHHKFNDFWMKTEFIMSQMQGEDQEAFLRLLRDLYEEFNWEKIEEEKIDMEDIFKNSTCKKAIERELIKFLDSNPNSLTMYGTPMKIKRMLNIYEEDPA